MSEEVRRDFLPGRERFIVPPLATKSTYFDNPITRQLWQDAFSSLKSAERIAIIGYSLPITDHITFGLLQSVLERRTVRLDVVNSNVTELEPRLKALVGVSRVDRLPSWVRTYDGINAIEDYTHELADERSKELIAGLQSSISPGDENRTMHIRWPRPNGNVTRRVFEIDGPDQNGVVTLRTATVRPTDNLDSPHGYDPNVERSDVTFADLIPRLVDASTLVASHGASDVMRLIDFDVNIPWIMFIPAGLVL
jgi:hypothetical protein